MAGVSPNRHVLRLASAWSAPLAVVQIIVAWVSLAFEGDVSAKHQHSVLHHFFSPYEEGTPAECVPAARCACLSCTCHMQSMGPHSCSTNVDLRRALENIMLLHKYMWRVFLAASILHDN